MRHEVATRLDAHLVAMSVDTIVKLAFMWPEVVTTWSDTYTDIGAAVPYGQMVTKNLLSF